MKRWCALAGAGHQGFQRLTSDKRVAELAKIIRETPGCLWTVVPIGPETYNRMHNKMRTVNKMLAWGHARVIENLLERGSEMGTTGTGNKRRCPSKSTVADALMELGRELELIQRHKAEDLAVAGASILARDVFVQKMAELSEKSGVLLPKGWGTGGFGGQKTGGNAGAAVWGGSPTSFSQCSPGLGRARTPERGICGKK